MGDKGLYNKYAGTVNFVVDVGTFHLEADATKLTARQISRIIAKSCDYAKKLQRTTKAKEVSSNHGP